MKRIIGNRARLSLTRKSSKCNEIYCKKEGNFFEYGTCPEDPGTREKIRWDQVRAAALAHREEDIPDDVYVRNYFQIRAIQKDHPVRPAECDNVTGVWIYGPSGIGKSRYARDNYPNAYDKNTNKWWDGYAGEDFVLIDDLDPDHACLRGLLKRWADRYPFTAETKGSSMCIRPKKIIVTSQYKIEEIWTDQATREALKRRFQCINIVFPYNGNSATPRPSSPSEIVLPSTPEPLRVVNLWDI